MRALRVIVAIEAATLAVAVALMLQSEGQKHFPRSVTVDSRTSTGQTRVVPVSVDLGSRGTTTTRSFLPTRGGRAATTAPSGANTGTVGFHTVGRATAVALAAHSR